MKPSFTFERNAPPFSKKNGLFMGILNFEDPEEGIYIDLNAISGVGVHQEDEWRRGSGWIPPSSGIKGAYSVNTTETPSQKIGGYGFHITPDPVYCLEDESLCRSELLIHFDNNKPGTSGCIGVQSQIGMDTLRSLMLYYRRKGVKTIPLEVV